MSNLLILKFLCIVKNKKCKIGKFEYIYTGEIDQDGNVCGDGEAKQVGVIYTKHRGTFFNN